MEQVRRFSLDVGWGLASSIVTLLIGLLLRMVLAWWLGAANLGLYQMVLIIQVIATLIASLGIPLALIKYAAEYKDDKEKLSQTAASGLSTSIFFGILAGILLYALSGTLADIFSMPELAHLLRILAPALPFVALGETLLGLLNGLRKMRSFAFLIALRSLLMLLSIIAFVKVGLGIEGVVFGIILSTIGGCAFGLYASREFLRPNFQNYLRNAKRLVSFGGQAFGADAAGFVVSYTDIVLIGYFLAAADVGHYSIAVSLSMLLTLIPHAIQRITFPATSEYWSKSYHQALQKMVDKGTKYSACILLPLGLGVGFFSEEIIRAIFGGEFIYAASPLCVLLIARVIRGSTAIPVGGSFGGIGRPDLNLKISTLEAGVSIALNVLLIPRFGILGAAIATTVSLLLGTAIFLVLMSKVLRVRIDLRWFTQAIGFAGLAVLLFLATTRLIGPYIAGGVILCAYIALVFKLLLTEEDKEIFRSLARSMMPRR